MYRSITGYGRNAIAVKTAYVGESKICRYEIPYGVTGIIKHTGLKGRVKGIMHRWEYRNVESPGCGVDTHDEALNGKIVSPLWEVRYNRS